MDTYRVVGDREVAGKGKGQHVQFDGKVNVQALIDGGHIQKVEASRTKKGVR